MVIMAPMPTVTRRKGPVGFGVCYCYRNEGDKHETGDLHGEYTEHPFNDWGTIMHFLWKMQQAPRAGALLVDIPTEMRPRNHYILNLADVGEFYEMWDQIRTQCRKELNRSAGLDIYVNWFKTVGEASAQRHIYQRDSHDIRKSIVSTNNDQTAPASVSTTIITTDSGQTAAQCDKSLPSVKRRGAAKLRGTGRLNKDGTSSCSFPDCTTKHTLKDIGDLSKVHKASIKTFFCSRGSCTWSTQLKPKPFLKRHEASHDDQIPCESQGCELKFTRADNMVNIFFLLLLCIVISF